MTRIISKAVALASRTLTTMLLDVRWWPKFLYTTIILVQVLVVVHQCFWIDSVMCQDSSGDYWIVDRPFVQRSHRSFVDTWSSQKNMMDPTSQRRTTTKTTTTTMQQQPEHLNDENNQWPTTTMKNITVTLGRNATFECVFPKLKDFQLVWFHQDKKNHHHTLLAMHDTIISKNGRISVRSHANTTFYLTVHDAQENDRGIYKCQVNTKPMRTQSAHLEVNVPPSFIEAKTSSDVDIAENASVSLQCQAEGRPIPEITWRREDGQPIVIDAGMYDHDNNNNSFALIKGHNLNLKNVTRHQMGAYLCIASNGIPPTISKRIFLGVGFAPVIWTNKKMVDGSQQSRATLECFVESYPRASVYWQKNDEFPPIIYSDRKYSTFINDSDVPYRFVARLRVNDLQKNDFTKYTCVATNKIGTDKAAVQLREVEKKFQHHHPKHRNHLGGQKATNSYYELNSDSRSNNHNNNNNNNNNNNGGGRKKLYQNIMTTRIPDNKNIRRTGNQASAGNINDNNGNNNNKGSRKKININYDDDDDDDGGGSDDDDDDGGGSDDDDATEQDMWQYETNYLSPGLSPDRTNTNNNGARSFHHPWPHYHHFYYYSISSTLQQPWCGLILIIINVHAVVAVWILEQHHHFI